MPFMRRFPSFPALRAFEAAARLGSFKRASDELNLTPSAISHQIRALEAYFGLDLFLRDSRAKILTEDGGRLAAGLVQAFDAIDSACHSVAPRASATTLAVHCGPSFAAKWLGPRLAGFRAQHPSVAIRLSSGAGSYDLIRYPQTDVAIIYGDGPIGPGVTAIPLGEERVMAVCAPGLASAGVKNLALIESLVSPVRWSDWFAANGLGRQEPVPMTGFDRGALVIAAAVQGMGAALETERFMEAELASGQLVALGGYQPIRCVLHRLLTRTGPALPQRVRLFRAWLLEELAAPG